MAEAEKRWGKLPPTYTSTSRDDGISGIRIYKIPNGVKLASLVEFPELELGDIEIIQHHHRYVTSWPSMHPDGRQYGWRDPAWSVMDGPPRADDIPELSQTWVEGLAVRPKARGKNKDKPRIVEDTAFVECPYVIERSLTAGEMSAKVAKRLGEATAHCYSDSRHDHILGDTLALLRYGKRGESGVFEAMSTLMKTFAKAVAKDRPGGEQEAEDEFMRMLSNEGAARLLSDGDDPDDQVPNDDDAVEPLHGLPHEDYGREFDAPPPSAPLAVARHIDRLFRIDGCPHPAVLARRVDVLAHHTLVGAGRRTAAQPRLPQHEQGHLRARDGQRGGDEKLEPRQAQGRQRDGGDGRAGALPLRHRSSVVDCT